jgi:hypothetical protein
MMIIITGKTDRFSLILFLRRFCQIYIFSCTNNFVQSEVSVTAPGFLSVTFNEK